MGLNFIFSNDRKMALIEMGTEPQAVEALIVSF